MANKKLTDFNLSTSLQSGDFLIGYKANASSELKTTFQTLQDSLPSLFKYQGTDLKALSGNWEDTYTSYQANSGTWDETTTFVKANSAIWETDSSIDTQLRSLSGNWNKTFSTVQTNSASNWDNTIANQYSDSKFLPLSGGDLTGMISLSNVVVDPGQTFTDCLSCLVITINGQQFKVPLLAI